MFRMIVLFLLASGAASAQTAAPIPVLSIEPVQMFVGLTTTAYDGDIEGSLSLTTTVGDDALDYACQLEYAGTTACEVTTTAMNVEFSSLADRATIMSTWPTSGAWAAEGGGCSGWDSNSSSDGGARIWKDFSSEGEVLKVYTAPIASPCNVTRPVACCAPGVPDTSYVPEPGMSESLAAAVLVGSLLCRG